MTILAYVLLKVGSGLEREACKKVADFEEVLMADITYGEYDVTAKIAAANMEALDEFLTEKLRKVPGVLVTSTMIIAREYKGRNNRTTK